MWKKVISCQNVLASFLAHAPILSPSFKEICSIVPEYKPTAHWNIIYKRLELNKNREQ